MFIKKKNRRSKISWHCPFKLACTMPQFYLWTLSGIFVLLLIFLLLNVLLYFRRPQYGMCHMTHHSHVLAMLWPAHVQGGGVTCWADGLPSLAMLSLYIILLKLFHIPHIYNHLSFIRNQSDYHQRIDEYYVKYTITHLLCFGDDSLYDWKQL